MEKITYYSDDPTLQRRTVTTIGGATEYRVNCKRIKGEFHIINKDCFQIGDTWYRISSGLIEQDYETNQWFLMKNPPRNMVTGVVSVSKDGEFKIGKFTANQYNNVRVNCRINGRISAINAEIFRGTKWVEDLSTGEYVDPDRCKRKPTTIENCLDHTGKGYNIEENKGEYGAKVKLYDEFKTDISPECKEYAKMLGDTSFGAELEAARGYLPDNLQNQLGVVICRDGSLKDENGKPGPEFVTIPLKGAKGLQTLSNLAHELSPRTVLDIKCSYHLHLGGINTTPKFVVALFRLGCKIQNELFQMFPYYKANPKGIKSKNYNQKLPSLNIYALTNDMTKSEKEKAIKEYYRTIFRWLSGGMDGDNIFSTKVHRHPNEHKWDRTARYFWLNTMNVMFSQRNTIEFRPHTPTANPQKVVNWLFICNAIVRYAEKNADAILSTKSKITMDMVMDYYQDFGKKGDFLSRYLKAYIKERKEVFFDDYEKGDKISSWEMDEDKDYVFSYEGVGELF